MQNDHPLIDKYRVHVDSSSSKDVIHLFSGVVVRREFVTLEKALGAEGVLARDEDYLSWVDLLEALNGIVDRSFTVVELGAGYGCWMLSAGCLLRLHHPEVAPHLIGVEAEPKHFRFMEQAFRDNGFEPEQHRLVNAAVGDRSGLVWFYAGESSSWYGQSVMSERHVQSMLAKNRLPSDYVPREEGEVLETTIVYPNYRQHYRKAVSVRMISLSELIGETDKVDFMHIDLHDSELDVLAASRDLIDAKVRLVHVGTHSTDIEDGLRSLFNSLGWQKRWDFPCKSSSDTPFGSLNFDDGVQSWLNPRLN